MTQTVELPWGKSYLKAALPDRWRVLGQLTPDRIETASDPAQICAEALRNPIGANSLASRDLSGRRAVLVVDDHSRPTPVRQFIHPVLQELASAGVTDEGIDILIATGVHRKSRPQEVEQKVGADVMSRLRWRCHDAYDLNGLAGACEKGQRGSTSRRGICRPFWPTDAEKESPGSVQRQS